MVMMITLYQVHEERHDAPDQPAAPDVGHRRDGPFIAFAYYFSKAPKANGIGATGSKNPRAY